MAWRGSLSRSVMATARSSTIRSSPPLPRLRPPPLAAPRLQSRRLSFANPRNLGELGCVQSLLPLVAGPCLTSHMAIRLRACCELSHGIGIGIDREEWKRWVMRGAFTVIKTRSNDAAL
ncbi:hypothetical protein RHMOL_Rhmol11G0234500 [Rhododendron molle]|uniref:Uncharacterized protein n=1 Tax=Rhododendron molle TaxID=49168 RepID=A0ACC0LX65_RHOML|nr:hypothetical protein RHMOL_Rhmol11G0234500 [Rhododendron molle]